MVGGERYHYYYYDEERASPSLSMDFLRRIMKAGLIVATEGTLLGSPTMEGDPYYDPPPSSSSAAFLREGREQDHHCLSPPHYPILIDQMNGAAPRSSPSHYRQRRRHPHRRRRRLYYNHSHYYNGRRHNYDHSSHETHHRGGDHRKVVVKVENQWLVDKVGRVHHGGWGVPSSITSPGHHIYYSIVYPYFTDYDNCPYLRPAPPHHQEYQKRKTFLPLPDEENDPVFLLSATHPSPLRRMGQVDHPSPDKIQEKEEPEDSSGLLLLRPDTHDESGKRRRRRRGGVVLSHYFPTLLLHNSQMNRPFSHSPVAAAATTGGGGGGGSKFFADAQTVGQPRHHDTNPTTRTSSSSSSSTFTPRSSNSFFNNVKQADPMLNTTRPIPPEPFVVSSKVVDDSFSLVDRRVPWLLDRLAFGSCAKQKHKDQPIWKVIGQQNPSAWLWTGDAVYPSCHRLECIERAYREQMETNRNYHRFLHGDFHTTTPPSSTGNGTTDINDGGPEGGSKSTEKPNDQQTSYRHQLRFVDGTWDDHDYGENDSGKYYAHKQASQKLFLEFLGVGKEEKRRYKRKGVYSSHVFGPSGRRQVKIILLDSRYHRDSHYIPSISIVLDSGVTAFLSAVVRWLCAFLGLGHDYEGDILGEDQWRWLEAQLTYEPCSTSSKTAPTKEGNSTIDPPGRNSENPPHEVCENSPAVHIIVSSIQVMTKLAVVESWGHFPSARRRLFSLLKSARPRGLILISGDVHFAELLGVMDGVLEVTSSGLTHSVSEEPLTNPIVGWGMLLRSLGASERHSAIGVSQAAYTGQNFGTLEFHFLDKREEEIEQDDETSVANAVRVEGCLFDLKGIKRISFDQLFRYDEDETERSMRVKMVDSVEDLIPDLTLWCKLGRGCGLGILFFWALQMVVLTAVLSSRRLFRSRTVCVEKKWGGGSDEAEMVFSTSPSNFEPGAATTETTLKAQTSETVKTSTRKRAPNHNTGRQPGAI